jgi:Fe-S oxidoreductase
MGIAKEKYRFGSMTLENGMKNWNQAPSDSFVNGKVCLFSDEFTNYYDVSVGIDAYELLTALGYEVILVDHEESGRAFISKGF